jgi:hypothetical protein
MKTLRSTSRRARIDPMIGNNAHIIAFAKANRLRTVARGDGEVVLRAGRRDSDTHVSFGLRKDPRVWTVFVDGMSTRQVNALEKKLDAAGAVRVVALDFELYADVLEADLFRVLGCSPRTALRPRRRLTDEQRADCVDRLARIRRPTRPGSEVSGVNFAPEAPGRLSEPPAARRGAVPGVPYPFLPPATLPEEVRE